MPLILLGILGLQGSDSSGLYGDYDFLVRTNNSYIDLRVS